MVVGHPKPSEREVMKKYGFRKFEDGWCFQIGGVNGESFEIYLRYFSHEGFRLTINLNTDRLIRLFGFNSRHYGV